MLCVKPGAVTPEEILSAVDGEAHAHVLAHLNVCPSCQAAVARYGQMQRHLRRALYRFDCPTPHMLGDFELHLLSPGTQAEVAAHLVACPHCMMELRQLRTFLGADSPSRWTRPVARALPVISAMRVPRTDAAYRSSAAVPVQTYRAGDVTIELTSWPARRGGPFGMSGLVWRDDIKPQEMAVQEIVLIGEGSGVRVTTAPDELGSFVFESLDPGSYRLEIAFSERRVAIDGLQIGQ